MQLVPDMDPDTLEYVPAAHGTQLAEGPMAGLDEYLPAAHGMQLVEADAAVMGPYKPAAHTKQLS